MSKVKLRACGGTGIEGRDVGEIEMDMCDFMLTIERPNGSKQYRLTADMEGNLIASKVSVTDIQLTYDHGYPALKLISNDPVD